MSTRYKHPQIQTRDKPSTFKYNVMPASANTSVRNVCDAVVPLVFDQCHNVCASYEAIDVRAVHMRATRAMFVRSRCVQVRRVQARRVWATCANNVNVRSAQNICNSDTSSAQRKNFHCKYHKYKHVQIQYNHSQIQAPGM